MIMRASNMRVWQPGWVRSSLRGSALVLLLALAGWEPLWRTDADVAAGNRAYAEGRFDDAIAAYERAERAGLDAQGMSYDLGTAWIGKANTATDAADRARGYDEALKHLGDAARAGGPLAGKANYNRGNVFMKQQKLDEAIAAYKDALRADPGLDAARVNLELAMRQRTRQKQQGPSQGGQQRQPGQGPPPPGQGQPPPGQGQPPPGQGQPPPGQGQSPGGQSGQQPPKQGQPSPEQGQPSPGQSSPPASDSPMPPESQAGAQQGDSTAGPAHPSSPPPPSPGAQRPRTGQTAPSRPQPNWPHDDTEVDTPNTSPESKLEQLEEMSRQLRSGMMRRETARRGANGDYRSQQRPDW